MSTNTTQRTIVRTAALAAATALTAIGLAACGGGDDSDPGDMKTQDNEQMTSDGGGMGDGDMTSDGGGMDDGS